MRSPRCRNLLFGAVVGSTLLMLGACAGAGNIRTDEVGVATSVDGIGTGNRAAVDSAEPPARAADDRLFSSTDGTWNWYLGDGTPQLGDHTMVDLDLFDTSPETVAELQADGATVVCYLSAGTLEDWRPDVAGFDESIIGNTWPEWDDERFLDISRLEVVGRPLKARLDLCAATGFDGVEADNVDAYGSNTGFDLTVSDAAIFVRWLADEAHKRGLGFGLKNTSELFSEVGELVDFVITEDCYADGWCDEVEALTSAGVAVYAAEYTDALGELTPEVCDHASASGISVAMFDRDLDGSYYAACEPGGGGGSRSDETGGGGGNWTRSNPGGGGAYSTVAISADGATILAGSDLSGISRSNDGGATWTVVGPAGGLTDTHISSIGFDRFEPDRVFVGTDGGLWVSDDAGVSFERRNVAGYLSAVVSVGDFVYAAPQPRYNSNDASIVRSSDAGRTFSKTSPLPEGLYVLAIRVANDDEDHVLVLTGPGRFADSAKQAYESFDGGTRWSLVGDQRDVLDARFDPANSSVIWLAIDDYDDYYNDQLAEVDNRGDGELLRVSLGEVALAATRSGVLWFGSDGGDSIRSIDPRVQYSWDIRNGTWVIDTASGESTQVGDVSSWTKGWSKVYFAYGDSFNGVVPTFAFDPSNVERALWVNSQWIYETLDGGRTFHPIFTDEVGDDRWQSRGFDNVIIEDIAISSDEQTVYAGFWDLGCFVSADAGTSWQSCNTSDFSGDWDGYGGFTGTVAADPDRPEVAWSSHAQDWAAPAVLLRTDSSGAPGTWEETSGLPVVPQVLGLSIDPTSPRVGRTVYVTADSDVYRSVDDGLTWSIDFECDGCRVTAVAADGTAFAGGEAGLFRRSDQGWNQIGAGFAGDLKGPPWEFGWAGVVEIEIADGTIWTAVFDTGVFKSTDLGDTWELVLDDPLVRTIGVDHRDSQAIWAGTSSAYQAGGYDPLSRGLLKSVDGGESWGDTEIDLAWPFVTDIAIGQGGLVVVASPGEGLFFSRLQQQP